MWIVIVLAAFVLAAALQLGVLYGLGRRRAIGDELEYLSRARDQDPYAPDPFLRLPGLILLARGLGSESKIRGAMALLAVLTVATVALAAWLVGGSPVTLIAILLLLLPERLVYACHIWPDTLMAAVLAGVILVLLQTDANGLLPVLLLGTLAMVGTLVRLDFLPVAPLSGFALVNGGVTLEARGWFLLLAPTALALALWTWRNWQRYRRPLFDDTWAFNAIVAAELAAAPRRPDLAIELLISDVRGRWQDLSGHQRAGMAFAALGAMLRRPLATSIAIARRVRTYLGPAAFVVQRLLPSGGAYPELSPTVGRRLEPLLRLGFPLLVTLCLLGSLVLRESPPAHVWPAAGVAIGSVLVHTRTRYRVVVMPALALWAADVSVRSASVLAHQPIGPTAVILAAGLGLVLLLGRLEVGRNVFNSNFHPSEARILELQGELDERLEWVRQLESEGDSKSRTILDLQDALDERFEWVRQLEAEGGSKSQTVLGLQDALEERLEWVRQLEAEGDSKNRTVLGLQGELGERLEWVRHLEAEGDSKSRTVLGLQGELDERLEWVRQLESEGDSKNRTVLELQGELGERLEWVRHLEAEGDSKNRTVLELQGALDERLEWVRRLEADSARREPQVLGLAGRLEGFESSRLFRLVRGCQRVRDRLLPHWSRRGRLYDWVMDHLTGRSA